jgi:acyl carrier protein
MDDDASGLRETLKQLISKEALVEQSKLVPEATLESLNIDSLDMSMLLMAIEEKFDIYLSVDSDLEQVVTFKDLVDLLQTKIQQGGQSKQGTSA